MQARFACAPLALVARNDHIELTAVCTNVSGLFAQAGHVDGLPLANSEPL